MDSFSKKGYTPMSGINICLNPSWRCSTTDIYGNYNFSDVSPGNYTIYSYLPSGYVATTPTWFEIIINSTDSKVINFASRLPIPPPSDVNVAQQSGLQNGIPTVIRPTLTVLTITKNLTMVSENVVSVNLTMKWSDGTTMISNMTEIGSTNMWSANFSAPFPGGTTQMRFEVDISPAGAGPEDALEIGDIIFIDPSGLVRDAFNGSPVSNATVTLLVEYPPGTDNFVISPEENQIPIDNPLITGDDGRYSWLTIPGTYKVRVEKAGYITAESGNVTVPPIVTDLNISLIPILPAVRFINGTVKDHSTGNSISGVNVSANSTLSTLTNATGFYSFAVTNGSYNLVSTINDIRYYTNTTMVSTNEQAVVIWDIEMVRKPTGNITGNVSG